MGQKLTVEQVESEIEILIENFVVNTWWEDDSSIPQKYADLWFQGAPSKAEYVSRGLDCKCPDAGMGLCFKCHNLNVTTNRFKKS